MEKKLVMYVATCWKLSTMFISSQIDSTAKIGHPECIKHDLELVCGKKVIYVCCNLLNTVHNVNFISNRQHSKNWTSRVHQTWFRACFWKKKKLVMYVATCWKLSTLFISSRINRTFFWHPECSKHEKVEKWLFLYFNVATCWKLSTMFISS